MSRKLALLLSVVLAGATLAPQAATASTDFVPALARYDRSQVQLTQASATTLLEKASRIGPGSHLFMTFDEDPDATYGCTANYVWADGDRLFLGAAGHCFLPADKVATHGVGADYDPSGTNVEVCVSGCTNGGISGFLITGTTIELGPVVYARQSSSGADDASDIGYDFGLVEVPAEHHGLIRTTMPVFGGPTSDDGTLREGDVTCHYGNGVVVGEVYPTMGRIGAGLFESDGAWFAATPAAPGDSGSALQTCTVGAGGATGDQAIGALTHLSTLGVAGTTIERAEALARQAGLAVTAVL